MEILFIIGCLLSRELPRPPDHQTCMTFAHSGKAQVVNNEGESLMGLSVFGGPPWDI